MRFETDASNHPTAAILSGVGAQATFQNTAGQVIVATSNSPGTLTIPIGGDGNPSIPSGSDLTVVSNNPDIPSTSSSASPGGNAHHVLYAPCYPTACHAVTINHMTLLLTCSCKSSCCSLTLTLAASNHSEQCVCMCWLGGALEVCLFLVYSAFCRCPTLALTYSGSLPH